MRVRGHAEGWVWRVREAGAPDDAVQLDAQAGTAGHLPGVRGRHRQQLVRRQHARLHAPAPALDRPSAARLWRPHHFSIPYRSGAICSTPAVPPEAPLPGGERQDRLQLATRGGSEAA